MTTLTFSAKGIMRGESTASQLPGRIFGPADAYRHILLAAELTRAFGAERAVLTLTAHETEAGDAADNGIDFWNNDIGIRIGLHVASSGGGWRDVVRLAREAVVKSFEDLEGYSQIPDKWRIHEADEGIRLGYEQLHRQAGGVEILGHPLMSTYAESFEDFAVRFNRGFDFRTANTSIQLDDGRLEVNPIAMTSPQFWQTHPEVDGRRLTIEESAYPDEAWASGFEFVYEQDNAAPEYYRSEYGTEPPVGFGGVPEQEQRESDTPALQKQTDATGVAARPAADGLRTPESMAEEDSELTGRTVVSVTGDGRLQSPGHFLLAADATDPDRLLTIPGHAMSRAQREALMGLPAFSDDSDPLFGSAVWKYRDANAHGAERAAATGAVDIFGRPAKPVFADADGSPADADGRPIAEALAGLGRQLDTAADAVGPVEAAKALQGAVNDLGDAQVKAETKTDGRMANRLSPRVLVDGVIGPRTGQAVRLALHHAGQERLAEALAGRLTEKNKTRTYD